MSICSLSLVLFELGFSVFYLNRCNRSGVLNGGAPIGGYSQTGKWRLDARFYRRSLADRILAVAKQQDKIHITNMDAITFLTTHLPRGKKRQRVFAYLDPPYYFNGNRLYMNFYQKPEHRNLSRYINRQVSLKWLMSYDNADLIRKLYKNNRILNLPLQYSFQRKLQAWELLIAPFHVKLPASEFQQEEIS